MMIRIVNLCTVFLLLAFPLVSKGADITLIDSLENALRYAPYDSNRIIIEKQLYYLYDGVDNTKADFHLKNLTREIVNGKIHVSHSILSELAFLYKRNRSDYNHFVVFMTLAMDQAQAKGELTWIEYECWLGYTCAEMGETQKAIEHLVHAVTQAENNNMTKVLPLGYTSLGFSFRNAGLIDRAITFFKKTITVSETLGDSTYLHIALHELGNLYGLKKLYNKAIDYHQQALEIRKRINQPHYLLYSYNDIGLNYYNMDSLEKALEFFLIAEQMSIDLNDTYTNFVVSINVCNIYIKLNEFSNAGIYIEKLEPMAVALGIRNTNSLMFEVQYKYYKGIKDFEKALINLEIYALYKDSLTGEEIKKHIEELDKKYETNVKDQKIADSQTYILKQQYFIVFILLTLAVFVVLIFIIFKQYRDKLKVNHQLEIQNDEIKMQIATKDRLFSIIGHDLRGPIGGFKSLVELMITSIDARETKQMTEILKIIHQEANTTYELLENLLSWAKSQRNEIVFKPESLNLKLLADNCLQLYTETVKIKKLRVINSISTDLIVIADANMLMTVLRNLFSNAIKFTPEGKSIELFAENSGNSVTVHVKDEGIGISEQNMSRLFKIQEAFVASSTTGEKGSGLGLLLCKEFIERHNGKIWVNSTPGQGSTFSFILK